MFDRKDSLNNDRQQFQEYQQSELPPLASNHWIQKIPRRFADAHWSNSQEDTQYTLNKGNNKITELWTILQRESQNS